MRRIIAALASPRDGVKKTSCLRPSFPASALRHLRGLGHALEPVIFVGKHGVTESLVEETKRALLTHELVKVKVQSEAPQDRKETAEALADAAGAVLAQVLGRTCLLYRRHPNKPQIELPKKKAASKVSL